jgi:glycosyltransferase involved in cell wall biosynthesis
MIEDGKDGLLVPPGEPERLAAALAGLLDNPRRRDELAAGGTRRIAEFDVRTVARRYEQLWSSLAGAAGERARPARAAGGPLT